MPARPILLLGDPLLWRRSMPVPDSASQGGRNAERQYFYRLLVDLKDTLLSFRRKHGSAKAIAAPQIGALSRVIYIHEPGPSRFLMNPVPEPTGAATIATWESCMSFPGLYVRTRRSAACSVTYRDEDWTERTESAEGVLAVIFQHECDHLDGVLSLQRAADGESFFLGGPGRLPPPANTR